MPLLRFHGLSVPLIRTVASELTSTLSSVVGCPPDWFTFEALQSSFISHDGQAVTRPPVYIDLIWFSRGQEVQDKVAKSVTEAVRRALQAEATVGEAAVDVTVIARTVEKEDFYENGKHF